MRLAIGGVLVAVVAALLLPGCGGTKGKRAEFIVATFNAGLAPVDVDYAAERAPSVVGTLAEQPVDLLCVQELWLEDDWNALVTAAANRFPSTVRLPAEPVDALCSPTEFEPLQTCVEGACDPDAAGGALADCALASCDAEVGTLSPGCTDCLLTGIGMNADIGPLRTDCLGGGDTGAVEAYIYEGAYDTGILTAVEVLEQDSLVLDSYLLRASVNYARVATELGELHVFCTHLASAIPPFEYRGDHGTWEGEQARQIEQLLAYIEAKTGGLGAVVVLGDLNTGPAIEAHDLGAQWVEHHEALIESGLHNPYAEQPDVACTSCPESTFHSPDSDGSLIDHILLQRFDGPVSVERFLSEPITIQVDDQDVETHLSDHFGLVMTLEGEAR